MAVELEGRIKIAAETGAAQDALGKLADEMKGLAKATDGAGSEQKKLARQTGESVQATQQARDAVERLKRAQNEARAVAEAFGKDSREAAEAQQRLKVAQEAATKATREAERALEASAKAVAEAARSADDKAKPAIKRMGDALQRAGQDADRLATDLRTLEARIASTGEKAEGFWSKFKSGAVFGLGAAAATGAVSMLGDGLHRAGEFAIETAATFETLRTALATTTGSSEAAAAAFGHIQKFAAETPFGLEEVADAFIKLKNQGLDPSDKALRAYGDIASAMGKSLDDITEAVLDAAQGEGERLKEFGIRMAKQGDQVALTFRGVTKTVKFSSEEITKYLVQLGERNFAGGMEAQSKTLAGLWSTLQDTAAQFADSVMQSGVSDALKEILVDLTAAAGGGKELAETLGGSLAEGLKATYNLMKALIPVIEGTARAFNWVFESVNSVNDPITEAAAKVHTVGREVEVAEQRLIAYGKAHGEAAGPLGQMIEATFLGTRAQENYNRAIREGTEAREAQARREAEIAGLRARRDQEDAARLARLQGEKDARNKAAKMAEFNVLSHDKSLSPSERKRLQALSKELDVALPKKGKKKEKKETFGMKAHDFDASVDAFEFDTTKDVRAANLAAEVKAFEAESALRQRKIDGLGAEAAALDELAGVQHESIDMMLYTVEVEGEAAARREEMLGRQMDAEIALARWQLANAKTQEQREKAETRIAEIEGNKRAAVLHKQVSAEIKEHNRRQKVIETVAGAVTSLGEGMVDAIEKAAEGEKGAIAQMLAELLKGVAKKHAILALGEAALAIGAAASYRYAAAAQHGTAAALHTGVAIAAGAGAAAAGAIAEQRAGGGGAARESGFGPARGSSAPGGSGGGGASDEGLEAQQVPISQEQLRRGNARMPDSAARMGGGAQVVISGTVNLYGAGGKEEFMEDIRRGLDRQNRAGRRPRI